MTRLNGGGQPHFEWEVFMRPVFGGVQTYTLPDLPGELGDLFPGLAAYDFLPFVRCRAESYDRLDFDAILDNHLQNTDPLWQTRGGYLAKEKIL